MTERFLLFKETSSRHRSSCIVTEAPAVRDEVRCETGMYIFMIFVSMKQLIIIRSSRGGFYFGTGERQSKQSAHFLGREKSVLFG